MPSTIFPPERWSRVSAAIARAVGVRADIWHTDVPSRIPRAGGREPHHDSGVSASEP